MKSKNLDTVMKTHAESQLLFPPRCTKWQLVRECEVIKNIIFMAGLLSVALQIYAQPCLEITCSPNKSVACGSTWSFDTPTVTNACGCFTNTITLTVVSTITNSPACTIQDITQTWRANDRCGHTNFCSQTVTVLLTNAPVFVGATNITVSSCTNVTVFYTVTATQACCGVLPVTCIPPSGSSFSPGRPIQVQCVVSNCCGQPFTDTFTVSVVDTNTPVFQRVSPITIASCGPTPVFYNPTASEACCGPLPVVCSPPSGSLFPLGSTLVTCTTTDCFTGVYTTNFYVNVVEGNSLVLSCTDKSVVCGTSWTYDPPTIYDPCCPGTNYTVTTLGPFTNGISACGQTNSITFDVTDQCGNSNQCSQTVTILNQLVLYPANPTITCGSPFPTNPPAFSAGCCTNVTFTLQSSATNISGCGQTIYQLWQATDCCSNTLTTTNIVTVLPGTVSVVCSANKALGAAPCALGNGLPGYTVLHYFPTSTGDGSASQANLLQASDHNFYGTTRLGGTYNQGTVFVLSGNLLQYTVLYSFGGSTFDGAEPVAGLIEGSDGFLYGTTLDGGQYGYGTVFKIPKGGLGYSVLHSFGTTSTDGKGPAGSLVLGSNGNLYGTTSGGGAYGSSSNPGGTVFTLKTNGGFSYQVLYNFGNLIDPTDGQAPLAGLVIGLDNFLYGTTESGGVSGLGTIFKLSQAGTRYTQLYSFTIPSGYYPRAPLVFGANSALFGTASLGGPNYNQNQGGVVFTIQTNGNNYAVLYNFGNSATDGNSPISGLLVACDQTLYGTTAGGGTSNLGTVFTLRQDGSAYAVMKSFTPADGDDPWSGLIQGSDGNLYGTTLSDGATGNSNGNGTLFMLPPALSGLFDPPTVTGGCCGTNISITVLSTVTNHSLCSQSFTRTWQILACCGQSNRCSQTVTVPITTGPVLTCSNLTLTYGSPVPTNPPVAYEPGCSNITVVLLGSVTTSNNCGQVISRTWQATDCCSNNSVCVQLVTLISPPVITCASNKTVPCTTAWSFDPPSATDAGCTNLTYALLNSNLVSATACQQVYAGTWQVTDCCGNTSTCTQLVTVVAAPPTVTCPTNKTVSLTTSCPQGGNLPGFTIMHSFPAFDGDGATPNGILLGSDQVLYGACAYGGAYSGGGDDGGTVFKINQDGTGYAVLQSLGSTSSDVKIPYAGLIEGFDGRLYGTAGYGGGQYGNGGVFALGKDGSGYTVLYAFGSNPSDGNYSLSALVQGSDGTLYGTTTLGGAYAALNQLGGTVFAIQPDGSGFHVIHSFNSFPADGITPYGPLVIGPDGALYGTTPEGGLYGGGTLFRLTPDGGSYTQLHHFGQGNDGAYPYAGVVFGTNGALFGTAIGGGSTGAGAVFTIQTNGSGYAILYNFGSICNDGIGPNLLHVSCDGRLYGTTTAGGNGAGNLGGPGTVFGLNQDGSHYTILRNFVSAADGDESHDGLAQGPDGVLFGTTYVDGLYGSNTFGGALFKLPPSAPDVFDPPSVTCGCCGTNVSIIVLGTTTNNTASAQVLTRSWLVVDCCSRSNFCSQTVTVLSTNGALILHLSVNASQHTLTLTWTGAGTLESASDVQGPWTPLPNAMSPYTVQTTGVRQFYRLRGQ
jgi:uncharacterized repeat protein (TIGR03803 family)